MTIKVSRRNGQDVLTLSWEGPRMPTPQERARFRVAAVPVRVARETFTQTADYVISAFGDREFKTEQIYDNKTVYVAISVGEADDFTDEWLWKRKQAGWERVE